MFFKEVLRIYFLFKTFTSFWFADILYKAWRSVRAVEGARLESGYTALNRIEGSNPSFSAI